MKKKEHFNQDNLLNPYWVKFENLVNLPCYVFWKNTHGTYLGYNDYGAKNLGYNDGNEIVGKTDYEIFPNNIAKIYRENDREVIIEKKQLFVPEEGVIKNNFSVIFLSYKMPLYDKNQKVIGVLGIAFTRSITEINCFDTQITSMLDLAKTCNVSPPHMKFNHTPLSKKENLCLQYLCDGLTLKMIAKTLKVSPKTVETYITRAKIKMNCYNKTKLILAFTKL